MTQTISLGGRRLTRIGLGTNRLTDTPANRAFLEAAVDAGVNSIDTAHLYTGGESETAIGATLTRFGDRVTVATKGAYHPGGGRDGLRSELEQSFERLRTETIDLYYLHRVDPRLELEQSLGVLKEYLDAGRIEHLGLSEVSVAQIERARQVVPIAAVQNEYNLAERRHEQVVDHCTEQGIAFVAFYPLHGESQIVGELAERYGTGPAQIKLAWLLRRSPAILPIPGTLSIAHLRDNLTALEVELSDQDFEALSRA